MAETLASATDAGLDAARPAPAEALRLYHEAFRRFRPLALWYLRELDAPDLAQVRAVARCLRREGTMATRPLCIRIEAACRAAL